MRAGTSGKEDEYIVIPPDGGWGWVVVIGSFLVNLINDGIIYAFTCYIPHVREAFNATTADVSLAGSVLAGMHMLGGPVAGSLTNWLGFRTVAFLGGLVTGGGYLASHYVTNIRMFQLTFGFLAGVGTALTYTPAVVVVGFYFEKYRAVATSIAVCGSGAGTFAVPPLTNYLIGRLGWRNMLLVDCGMMVCAGIIGALVYRPVRPTRLSQVNIDVNDERISKLSKLREEKKGKKDPTVAEAVVLKQGGTKAVKPLDRDDIFYNSSLVRIPSYKPGDRLYTLTVIRVSSTRGCMTLCKALNSMLNLGLLTSPTFCIICIEGFLAMTAFYVPFQYLPERAMREGHIPPDMAYYLISIVGITNTVSRILAGAITSMTSISALWVNNIASVMAGVSTIVSGVNMTYEFQVGYAVVYGASIAGFITLRAVLVAEYMGLEKLTNGFGLLLLFQGIGICIGPPIAGLIKQKMQCYHYSFYFAGGLFILSAVICFPLDLIHRLETRET